VTDKVIGTPSGDPPSSAPFQAPAETVLQPDGSSAGMPLSPRSSVDQTLTEQQGEASPSLLVLGSKLAAARQAQGVSLEAMANRLHLGVSQLKAVECGDRSQLPETVFVIAYARRIADCLGISIDEELSALRSLPQDRGSRSRLAPASPSPRAAAAPPSPASRIAGPRSGSAPALPWRAALLAFALLGLVGSALALRPWSRLQPFSGMPSKRAPDAVTPQASSVTPAQGLPPKATLVPETTAPGAGAAATTSLDANGLVLSSNPGSWVSVRDRTGTVVFEGLLSGEKRFPLGSGLEVLAGRPDLVRAAVQGGEAKPLGTISQVEWYRFPATSAQPGGLAQPQGGAVRP
jgi:cytoskeleton protein RodZ